MTFCVGIRVRDGLVALADTQIVRGQEFSSKAKLSLHDHGGSPIFLMTSGLRSIRDKAVLRLEDELGRARAEPARPAPPGRQRLRRPDQARARRGRPVARRERAALRLPRHHRWPPPRRRRAGAVHGVPGGELGHGHRRLAVLHHRAHRRTASRSSTACCTTTRRCPKPSRSPTSRSTRRGPASSTSSSRSTSCVCGRRPAAPAPLRSAEDLTAAHDFWHEHLQDALDAFPIDVGAPICGPTEGEAPP